MRFNKITLTTLTLFSILFLILGTNIKTSNAQSSQTEPLTWGIKAGVNASDLYGGDINSSDTRAGFNGGLFLNYRFSKYFAIQPEVAYTEKGSEVGQGVVGEEGAVDYNLSYLEIPVLAKFYIPTGGLVEPNIYAGPEVGFKLNGEANDNDLDDSVKDAEFGLAFGGGVDFSLGNNPTNLLRTIGLDLRYTLGLTDVFDVPGDPEARNGAFTAAISLGF